MSIYWEVGSIAAVLGRFVLIYVMAILLFYRYKVVESQMNRKRSREVWRKQDNGEEVTEEEDRAYDLSLRKKRATYILAFLGLMFGTLILGSGCPLWFVLAQIGTILVSSALIYYIFLRYVFLPDHEASKFGIVATGILALGLVAFHLFVIAVRIPF